jgi:anti-anti-sigma factor
VHDVLGAGPSPDCQFRVVATDGHVVAVAGEIDEGVVDAFRAALRPPDVRAVDLSLVTFLNSSGLRVLIEARGARSGRGGLELRNPSRQVRRVLELTGLDSWLTADEQRPPPAP